MSEAVEPAEASQTKQKDETVVTAEENAPAVPQPAATEDSVMADASVNDAPTTTEQKTGEFEETLAEPIEAATKEEQAVTDNANALETETVSKSDVPTSIPDPASTTADHEAQMAEQVESASEIQVPAPAPPATPAKTTAPASQPMSRTMSTAMGTEAADEATRAPVREYLQERVADWLLHGMKWLATRKPDQPLLALGEYLQLAHNWRVSSPVNEKKTPSDFEPVWHRFVQWQASNKDKPLSAFVL